MTIMIFNYLFRLKNSGRCVQDLDLEIWVEQLVLRRTVATFPFKEAGSCRAISL